MNELYPYKVPCPSVDRALGDGGWRRGVGLRVRQLLGGRQQELRSPPSQRSGAAESAGLTAVAETSSRIHIPAGPWPGTAQKIRKEPALAATNRTSPTC